MQSVCWKQFHDVFIIKVRRGGAVRWPQVGDTAAAMRLGKVHGDDLDEAEEGGSRARHKYLDINCGDHSKY